MQSAKLAIGLPVYNGEEYITDAIASILNQSRRDFVLIISDNASTDKTQDICEAFAKSDPRVKYERNETNLGINANSLKTLARASIYPFYTLIGHDDLWDVDYVKILLGVIENNPDISVAFCKHAYIDEAGQISQHNEFLAPLEKMLALQKKGRLRRMMAQPSTSFIHGITRYDEVIADIFEKRHGIYEDVLYVRYMSGKGKLYANSKPLFFKRMHKRKYSSSKEHQSFKPEENFGKASRKLTEFLGLSKFEEYCVRISMIYYFRLLRPLRGRLARFKKG